jgi:Uma2 family endonuclease
VREHLVAWGLEPSTILAACWVQLGWVVHNQQQQVLVLQGCLQAVGWQERQQEQQQQQERCGLLG